jgi:transcriptional regulator with XRE-family HTH domain
MPTQRVDTRVHWFRIFVQLKAKGYSIYDVANKTGIPRSTLVTYQSGTEPRYSNGEHLLQFWARELGKTVDEAPKISPFSYKA